MELLPDYAAMFVTQVFNCWRTFVLSAHAPTPVFFMFACQVSTRTHARVRHPCPEALALV